MSSESNIGGVKISYKSRNETKSDDKGKAKRVSFDKDRSKPNKRRANHRPQKQNHEQQFKSQSLDHFLTNPRYCAVDIILKIERGQSLSDLLVNELKLLNDSDKRFVQHLVYGTLRRFEVLKYCLGQYLQKPIKSSERSVTILLLLAIYEITEMNTAEYAAVNNWVTLIRAMQKEWAVGLVNGILRKILREGLNPLPNGIARFSLPKWLFTRINKDWGIAKTNAIATYFMQHPQMAIRVNPLQSTREAYCKILVDADIGHEPHEFIESSIVMREPISVSQLPSFAAGACSVQDSSAQLTAQILTELKGKTVIDACAAPGGKTVALLESNPEMKRLYAVDSVEKRLERVKENIDRVFTKDLSQKIELITSDFSEFNADDTVDAILLDVPCSATGIIHRHPDINLLRKESDIAGFVDIQAKLLDHAWTLLKKGGQLLYSTCSILKDENERQMATFLEQHTDAVEIPLNFSFSEKCEFGQQILPIYTQLSQKMDGFYYCLLQKNND